jgi:hypothetical protein
MDIGIPRMEILTAGSKKAQESALLIRPTSTAVSLWDLSHQENNLSASFKLAREIISCANQLFSALKQREREELMEEDLGLKK